MNEKTNKETTNNLDIYEEILRDHREIKALQRELASLNKNDEYRLLLISELRNSIVAHGRTEEAVLYHSLRLSGRRGADAALKGLKQHLEIEAALLGLQAVERLGANWRPMARKMGNLIDTHIKAEEQEIFPLSQKVFNQREANKMGRVYRSLRPAMEQKGELRLTMGMLANFLPPLWGQVSAQKTR